MPHADYEACFYICYGICATITEGAGLIVCAIGCAAACAELDPA